MQRVLRAIKRKTDPDPAINDLLTVCPESNRRPILTKLNMMIEDTYLFQAIGR